MDGPRHRRWGPELRHGPRPGLNILGLDLDGPRLGHHGHEPGPNINRLRHGHHGLRPWLDGPELASVDPVRPSLHLENRPRY